MAHDIEASEAYTPYRLRANATQVACSNTFSEFFNDAVSTANDAAELAIITTEGK